MSKVSYAFAMIGSGSSGEVRDMQPCACDDTHTLNLNLLVPP